MLSIPFPSKFISGHMVLGGATGQHPIAKEIFVFVELNMHNFRPFLSRLN